MEEEEEEEEEGLRQRYLPKTEGVAALLEIRLNEVNTKGNAAAHIADASQDKAFCAKEPRCSEGQSHVSNKIKNQQSIESPQCTARRNGMDKSLAKKGRGEERKKRRREERSQRKELGKRGTRGPQKRVRTKIERKMRERVIPM